MTGMTASSGDIAEDWNMPFRHSAGRVGSIFLTALREGRLLGWRGGTPSRIHLPPPPMASDQGEWVVVGPGARLIAYAAAELEFPQFRTIDDGCVLALVRVDGTDTAFLSRLRLAAHATALPSMAPLTLHFAEQRTGSLRDFWFEPVPMAVP